MVHWTRKTLSNIATVVASLEHLSAWAVVRISTVVHTQRHAAKSLTVKLCRTMFWTDASIFDDIKNLITFKKWICFSYKKKHVRRSTRVFHNNMLGKISSRDIRKCNRIKLIIYIVRKRVLKNNFKKCIRCRAFCSQISFCI